MKVSELVDYLLDGSSIDKDVFIKTEDGILHEIRVSEREATFDGFNTVYEGGFNLEMAD